MGNKKNKTTTLRGRKYGNFGDWGTWFLIFFAANKKYFAHREKKFYSKTLFLLPKTQFSEET